MAAQFSTSPRLRFFWSIVAAGSGGVLGLMDPADKAARHKLAGASYGALERQSRLFQINLERKETICDGDVKFASELEAQKAVLDKESPVAPEFLKPYTMNGLEKKKEKNGTYLDP